MLDGTRELLSEMGIFKREMELGQVERRLTGRQFSERIFQKAKKATINFLSDNQACGNGVQGL
jgi:hypothetical protein